MNRPPPLDNRYFSIRVALDDLRMAISSSDSRVPPIRGSKAHSRHAFSVVWIVHMDDGGAVEKQCSGNWAWIFRSCHSWASRVPASSRLPDIPMVQAVDLGHLESTKEDLWPAACGRIQPPRPAVPGWLEHPPLLPKRSSVGRVSEKQGSVPSFHVNVRLQGNEKNIKPSNWHMPGWIRGDHFGCCVVGVGTLTLGVRGQSVGIDNPARRAVGVNFKATRHRSSRLFIQV